MIVREIENHFVYAHGPKRAPIPMVGNNGLNRTKGKGQGKENPKGISNRMNLVAKASLIIKPRVKGKPKAKPELTLSDVERWLQSKGG